MEIKPETGAELLRKMAIEGFSNIYKVSLLVLIVLCIFFYKKYKISEEVEDCFLSYHLTWMSSGMMIASVFCFAGSNTDPFCEIYLDCIGAFMALFYLYSEYDISNKRSMTTQHWLQSFLLGLIDLILIIKISKAIVLQIILAQTLMIIFYETKKLNFQIKGE